MSPLPVSPLPRPTLPGSTLPPASPDPVEPGPIAVVGLACRYPQAPGAEALWELLLGEHEALTRFGDAELAQRGVPAALRRNPNYVPVGGVIDDQDRFDPAPFGIADSEADVLDPQQRLFLECAWHALEDAGHGGARDCGVVGVYAGSALSGYLLGNLAHRFDLTGGADPAGNLALHAANVADYLPLRVAHRLGTTGPAVGIGATCATSLAAVHLAVQALLSGECDTAIAGGVSLRVPQGHGYLHVPDGPFSRDGHTRPYAEGASGAVFTQGVGVVVLRRLADALRDGDPVSAVVLGSALGNDGAERVGFTAPSAAGQARTIAEAHAVAGVEPAQLSYVEGHGTGTLLGDPMEVQALRRVFGPARRPWCGLGSIKGNIGHADSAAGIAGLVKTVLALRHRTLPASLHARRPRTDLGLDGSALRLVAEAEPWEPVDGARLAGVSSFGIGGVNCHVVLGEAPAEPVPAADDRPQLVTISAATAAACRATTERVADRLADPALPLADAAHTLATGRAVLAVRTAAVLTPEGSGAELRRAPVVDAPATPPRVVFAFPGGDAQHAGMLRDLYADEPVLAAVVDRLADAFRARTGDDPREVLLAPPGAGEDAARAPRTGLPAGFTAAVALTALLGHHGVRPDLVLGHSIGEYAAAVTAGALTAEDAAEIVAERSLRMAELPAGAMLSVALGETAARAVLAEEPALDLAAVNAADACVLSGPHDVVEATARRLAARGVTARVLPMATAAHSRLVEPAVPALRAVAASLRTGALAVPMVSTVTGRLLDDAGIADPEHWARHLRASVRFGDALDTALAGGPAIVVQVGGGAMIASLAARRGRAAVPAALTTVPAPDDHGTPGRAAFLAALGGLWSHGVPVDLAATHRPGRRRVRLPGYAFERRRFWVDPPVRPSGAPRIGPAVDEPDPTEPLQLPAWRRLTPLTGGPAPGSRWLVWGAGPWARAVREAARSRGLVVVEAEGADRGTGRDLAGVLW
ncbi:MAG TPA: type I polyketide synthase, partial [Pseudonocardia sp.]|nr:type I polyketide synthase [Pseudonocardia sp.]